MGLVGAAGPELSKRPGSIGAIEEPPPKLSGAVVANVGELLNVDVVVVLKYSLLSPAP
jgi:hypothetical protein